MKILNRLNRKTIRNPVTGCWLWQGNKDEKGYGLTSFLPKRRSIRVSRLSAHLFLGLDLDDLSLLACHKKECSNSNCWNPEHIYIGNNSENLRDARDKLIERSANGNKTHCAKGHSYDKENTIIRLGRRLCRECNKNRCHIQYEKRKQKQQPNSQT